MASINIPVDVGQLLLSLAAAIALYIIFAFGIDYFGLIAFDRKSLLVSIPSVVGVLAVIILSALASGEIPWSKQGHDFTVLTFGAVLSTATLQFFSDKSVLPRLTAGGLGQKLSGDFTDARYEVLVLLFVLAFVTFIVCILTAFVESALKNAQTGTFKDYASWYRIANYGIGAVCMAFYVAIVCGGI